MEESIEIETIHPDPRSFTSATGEKKESSNKLAKEFFEKDKTLVGIVKHGILKHYFNAWLAIMCLSAQKVCKYSRVVFIDGFAGSGSYADKVDKSIKCADDLFGSPAITYRAALLHKNLPNTEDCPEICLILIEKDKENCEKLFNTMTKLKQENEGARNATRVKFMVIQQTFVEAMKWILSPNFSFPKMASEQIFFGPQITEAENVISETSNQTTLERSKNFITRFTPLLVFVDPFGYNGEHMPMTLMKEIQRQSTRAEILINLTTGFINRFVKLDSRTRPLNLLTGDHAKDASWKEYVLGVENSPERVDRFLDFYQKKLSETIDAKVFASRFEMRGERNQLSYHLFFVCTHPKGLDEMKRAMLKFTQSDFNFQFSAFKDTDGNFQEENISKNFLLQIIYEKFSETGEVTGAEITKHLQTHDTIVQKYRVELKRALSNFVCGGDENRFDDTVFDFSKPKNPTIPFSSLFTVTPTTSKPKKRKREPSDSKVKAQNKKEEKKSYMGEDIRKFFPPASKKS